MTIEKTTDEIIIRLPANVDPAGVQRLIDLLTYRENAATNNATQAVPSMPEVAKQLLADYQSDADLTAFTALDGEPGTDEL